MERMIDSIGKLVVCIEILFIILTIFDNSDNFLSFLLFFDNYDILVQMEPMIFGIIVFRGVI